MGRGPKYTTPLHRHLRKTWAQDVAQGTAYCTETICLQEQQGNGRWIKPGTPWDVAHTPDGQSYIGPAHSTCNRSEGAVRGNKQRKQPRRLTI